MSDDPKHPPVAAKPLPLWLAVWVLGAIMLGAGALVYKFVFRPPAAPNAVNVVSPAPGAPRMVRSRGNPPAGQPPINPLLVAKESELPDGMHDLPTGGTMAKAGDAYVKAFDRPDSPEPALSFGFFNVTEAQWEHGYLSNGVRRLLADDEYAKSLGVSGEQLKKLGELPTEPSLRWAEDVRGRFAGMFAKWRAAGRAEKAPAAGAMVEELRAYAQTKRAADQKAMDERVKRMRSILDAKQVEKMNPIPRWNLPTTKPGP